MMKKNDKQTVPELRFRGFTDPWEQRQLGEVVQRVTRRNLNNECSRVLTASAEAGLIDQQEYFQKRVASHDLSHYYLLERGDFAYNHSSSGNATLGIIKRLDAYDSGCLSTLYIVFHPKRDIDSDYLLHYFESSTWHGDVAGMVTEGARNHGLLNISPDTFFTARCSFPSLPEQHRIGEFFTTLDSLIAAAERQETLLRQKKQAYLQLMFPREGETQPRLRFSGFSGDWEQRQLGEVGTTYSGLSGKTKEDFGHGDACFVTYMNVYSNAVANPDGIEAIEEDPRQHEVMNGDVFFTGSSETPDEVGLSSVWLWNTANTYLNSFCFGYRPCQEFDSLFLAASLRSPQMRSRISLLAQGISRFNISKKQVMQQPLNYPSLPEQRLIGRFFSTLDSLIAAAEERTRALKEMKSAYLQRMFV